MCFSSGVAEELFLEEVEEDVFLLDEEKEDIGLLLLLLLDRPGGVRGNGRLHALAFVDAVGRLMIKVFI